MKEKAGKGKEQTNNNSEDRKKLIKNYFRLICIVLNFKLFTNQFNSVFLTKGKITINLTFLKELKVNYWDEINLYLKLHVSK